MSTPIGPEIVDGQYKTEAITFINSSNPPEITSVSYSANGADIVTDDELLVKIQAASVNPVDYLLHALTPWLSRSTKVMGGDYSGIVVKAGKDTGYKAGDKVWGDILTPFSKVGSFSQYAKFCPKEVMFTAKIPEGMSFVEAAALGVAYGTGYEAVTHHVNKTKDGKVLVLGGGTSVGRSTIQFAKYFGAKTVVATCSSKSSELVQKLGADVTVDYTKETELSEILAQGKFDLVVDCVRDPVLYGHFEESLKTKAEGGSFVQIAGTTVHDYTSVTYLSMLPWWPFAWERIKGKVGLSQYEMINLVETPDPTFPETVAAAWAEGKLKIDIDSTCPFKEFSKAFDKVGKSQARGKVVLQF